MVPDFVRNPPLWARVAAAALGGLVLHILAPPVNLHWLHWVAYVPMFWALRAETPRENHYLAVLYGTLGIAAIFGWIADTITTFSPAIPAVGAYAVLLIYSLAFGLPYLALWAAVHPLRARLGWWWVLLFPAWQVMIEWACTYLTLFPFHHGVSQYRFPYTWQLASITGIWGLTYLVFFVNTALAEAVYRHREGRAFPRTIVLSSVSALCIVMLYGAWRYERVEAALREAPEVRIAQLQSAKGMVERMRRPANQELEIWLSRTRSVPKGTDLVVWPEGTCPYDLTPEKGPRAKAREMLAEVARERNTELLIGGGSTVRRPNPDGEGDDLVVYNSAFHFRKTGELAGRYDKMVPLPFGEYLPFGQKVPDLGRSLGIGDFARGEVPVVFKGDKATFSTPICYEAILSRVCRRFENPELFVTITNDAWFGDTAAPHLHAMMAAVRAVELGVPVFRSAYTGVSLVVEPHGAIQYETEPFTKVHRVVAVRKAGFPTLYGWLGDWFVVLCGGALAFAWWRTRTQE